MKQFNEVLSEVIEKQNEEEIKRLLIEKAKRELSGSPRELENNLLEQTIKGMKLSVRQQIAMAKIIINFRNIENLDKKD